MPDVDLPRYRDGYPEDADRQVSPRASSVPHGGVRQAAARHVADRRLGLPGDDPAAGGRRHQLDRHRRGDPRTRPTAGSRATRRATSAIPSCSTGPGGSKRRASTLQIVFRDHALSDQIGFHYQRNPAAAGRRRLPRQAGRDRPRRRRQRWPTSRRSSRIILDGENCWEYYPDGGVAFLRSLYRGVRQASADQAGASRRLPGEASADGHAPAAVRRQLDQPQLRHLDRPPGGQPRLGRCCTRRASIWSQAQADETHTPAAIWPRAWDELYIAEGSDWFWWFGDDHSSARTPCSTTCSASTCRTSIWRWASRRRPSCSADQPGRASLGPYTGSRRAC